MSQPPQTAAASAETSAKAFPPPPDKHAGLADPDVRSRYAAFGSVPNPGSPADFGKLIVAETEKWAKVIKFAGIKPE